ncbi:MAG: response regulator transcription factor [Acidobacteria bacterium]|nr:response regulator transcription factor [Acidobacteriota bacterium]
MSEATIFLVEEDNDGRPALRENLKNNGYGVTLAIDEEDALDRVKNGYLQANLVLINLLRKSPEQILDIARRICRAGSLDVPIVVIAQRYGEELEGTNLKTGEKEYIAYLEDGEQLLSLLSRLVRKTA